MDLTTMVIKCLGTCVGTNRRVWKQSTVGRVLWENWGKNILQWQRLMIFWNCSSCSSVIALHIYAREYSVLFHRVTREIKYEVTTISKLRMKNKMIVCCSRVNLQGVSEPGCWNRLESAHGFLFFMSKAALGSDFPNWKKLNWKCVPLIFPAVQSERS